MNKQLQQRMENDLAKIEVRPAAPVSPTPEMLLSQAIDKGVGVETLERLLAMKERIEASTAKQAYNEDMAAFQAACPVIKKTKSVKTKSGIVAYKYAPIESVVKQVKTLLQKHGFRYSTTMELTGQTVKATCHITHALGHTEATSMEVPLGTKTDVMSQSQVVAAAQTFAKRYAFLNAFGIMTADEDTDGPDAETEEKQNKRATAEQRELIDELASKAGVTKADITARCQADFGVSYTEITQTQAQGIIDRLNLKIKKNV